MTGYNDPINYNQSLNYNGDIAPPVITSDTHDGVRRKRIHLPVYISNKKPQLVAYKQAIKALPKEMPKEIKQAITPKLAQYDIDWLALSGYMKESGEKIDRIMQELEVMRIQYEEELEEEEDFISLVLAAARN